MSDARERIRTYEVSRRVGEILHYLWDPIGVSRVPRARDEYDGYVPAVTALLMRGATKEEVASYLTRVSTEAMGLSDTPQAKAHDLDMAQLLIEHFASVDAAYKTNG